MMQYLDILFTSYQINMTLQLKNRIIMAPMTRNFAADDLSPTSAMADYYARRAAAGLIVTEGTIIRSDGTCCSHAPGIFSQQQVEGWKRVTEKVHQQNGHIFCQIWHVGRVSHPHFLNGKLPLAPSATKMSGRVYRSEGLHHGPSREATLKEIANLIESYAQAAENAIAAGFDGVEIHGANGYLIDQFLHYHTNLRQDAYGGSPENMARFATEVIHACGKIIGYERTALRLSPGAYLNEMVGDTRDAAVFQILLEQLNPLHLAYIHTGNFDDKTVFETLHHQTMTQFMRGHYQGTLVASGGYQFHEAAQGITNKQFDLIAIGRPFIANPNLIERLKNDQEIVGYNADMLKTLY